MNLKVLITQAFLPHSMAAIKPPPSPNPLQDKLAAWYTKGREVWNERAILQILDLIAIATGNEELKNFQLNAGGPIYDPLTVLSITKQHSYFKKNELILVTQGIDRYALSNDGVEEQYNSSHVRAASEIEVLAFYDGLTPAILKKLAFDNRFAHITDPLFNPSIEVVEEPVKVTVPLEPIHQI